MKSKKYLLRASVLLCAVVTVLTLASCGEKATDPKGDTNTAVSAGTSSEVHSHTVESIPGTPATCTANGLTDGVKCSVCGETLVEQKPIAALGHDWNEPTYEWASDYSSCTAQRICKRDNSHIEKEVATAHFVYDEDGNGNNKKGHYVAEFENSALALSTPSSPTIVVGDNGEAYVESPVISWEVEFPAVYDSSLVGKTCTVTWQCVSDPTKTITETAGIVFEIVTEPTCTGKGVGRYVARFTNPVFETQYSPEIEINALGHTYVSVAAIAATCTENGLTEGTKCSVCGDVLVAQETVPALGHVYENGKCIRCGKKDPSLASEGLEYAWNSDGESYYVRSIGSCKDSGIVISSTYNGHPVTSIGQYAFSGRTNLTSIVIPSSVTSINQYAFSGCTSLISIEIPDSVTSIGRAAFSSCTSLTGIVIPNSVMSIGEQAFENCNSLTSITIPNSVTNIGKNAFSGCNKLIQTENRIQYVDKWAIGFSGSVTNAVLRDDTVGIGNYAFSSCTSLTSIEIPNSVKSIGDSAFNYCISLTSITIPNSVTSIGRDAFRYCSSLTSIEIPNSVTSISLEAFQLCTSLTSVTIPNSVKSIGYDAFYNCASLTSITFTGTKEQWGNIKKDFDWDCDTGDYVIHCTDGDITK